MVKQSLKKLGLEYEARIDISIIEDYFHRQNPPIKFSKAFEFSFKDAVTDAEKRIAAQIEKRRSETTNKLQSDLKAQEERLSKALEKLKIKSTVGAEKEKGVSERQIDKIKNRLERLSYTHLIEEDSRIYAYDWAPVIIWRNNERVIVPMRYHLRPSNMKADFDKKYPGCYNARRDSLTGFWRPQFGRNHAVLIANAFYEHVEGSNGKNQILKFTPEGFEDMLIPCIYDHWEGIDVPGFDSFALITDNPPPEVVEAGHDRCPIFIKKSRMNDWLQPLGKSDEELFKILDDRERPYYRHQLAG